MTKKHDGSHSLVCFCFYKIKRCLRSYAGDVSKECGKQGLKKKKWFGPCFYVCGEGKSTGLPSASLLQWQQGFASSEEGEGKLSAGILVPVSDPTGFSAKSHAQSHSVGWNRARETDSKFLYPRLCVTFVTCIYELAYFCGISVEIQTTPEAPCKEPTIPDTEIRHIASRLFPAVLNS